MKKQQEWVLEPIIETSIINNNTFVYGVHIALSMAVLEFLHSHKGVGMAPLNSMPDVHCHQISHIAVCWSIHRHIGELGISDLLYVAFQQIHVDVFEKPEKLWPHP